MKFKKKLNNIIEKNNSLLCIGLDGEIEKIPPFLRNKKNPLFSFNKYVIDATYDLVCAYKPNIAFYEALGINGLNQLKKTIKYLQKYYPEIPIILDAKRADIGSTARMYAKAIFDFWQVDAVTVNPFLGLDSLIPFFEYKDKLIIVLVKTSNPDSTMFQSLKVAKIISRWPYQNIGIVVGATYPQQIKEIRKIFSDKIFLSPGIGTQGGEIEKVVKSGLDKDKKGLIINISRSIIYATNIRDKTKKLKEEINKYRK